MKVKAKLVVMDWRLGGEGVDGEEGEDKVLAATIGHRISFERWWWSWMKVVKSAKPCGGKDEGVG